MSKENLLGLRFIMPGLILLVILLPLLQPSFDASGFLTLSLNKDSIVYLLVVFFFGGIYYIFNPRDYVMRSSIARINENIKNRLLLPFQDNQEVKKRLPTLREGNKVMDIFYTFVDNDKVLTERAKQVHFNGLIMSTIADLRLMSVFATIIYTGAYLIAFKILFAEIAIGCLGLFIVTFWLLPVVAKGHIGMSNYQIDYVVDHFRKELLDQLIKVQI
jgi:hypothetical protein